jgi:hypothetical protein
MSRRARLLGFARCNSVRVARADSGCAVGRSARWRGMCPRMNRMDRGMDREKAVAFVERYGRTWQAWDFEGFAAAARFWTTFGGSNLPRMS